MAGIEADNQVRELDPRLVVSRRGSPERGANLEDGPRCRCYATGVSRRSE
jgi:hypothetical protein